MPKDDLAATLSTEEGRNKEMQRLIDMTNNAKAQQMAAVGDPTKQNQTWREWLGEGYDEYKKEVQELKDKLQSGADGTGANASTPVQQFLWLMLQWLNALEMGRPPILSREGLTRYTLNFGKEIGIYTMDTAEAITSSAKSVASTAKTLFGKENVEPITPQEVEASTRESNVSNRNSI